MTIIPLHISAALLAKASLTMRGPCSQRSWLKQIEAIFLCQI